MTSFHRPLRALFPLLLGLACISARSQSTEWNCWYSHDRHVSCQLVQAPAATELTELEAAVVRQPNAPSAPGFTVAVLRERPYALRGLLMRIPLWGEPFGSSGLDELSQAVMCGSRPDCLARYNDQPLSSLAAAAALADAWDPVLQLSR